MNAITLVIGAICVLAIAYRFYGIFFTKKVLKISDETLTPAHEMSDGKDYVPTSKWVAFGHHFAAIAAAGPFSRTCISSTIWLFTRIFMATNWCGYWWCRT